MSRTTAAVAARFQRLLDSVTPTPSDDAAFGRHASSVADALDGAGLRLNKVDVIGSRKRGTGLRDASDIDLLVVLERKEVYWGRGFRSSDTLLGTFRDVLTKRFRSTEIGRDGQAVVVGFGDGRRQVDVVPSFYERHGGPYNHPIFRIPNGRGLWMETSPSSHNRYIEEADRRAGGHLRGVARFFKCWTLTRANGVPIGGFHTELLMAATGACGGVLPYSVKFARVLALLADRSCAGLNDPLGISGRIDACATAAKREQACATVREAAQHGARAIEAEGAGDFPEAARQWDIVFNGYFPRQGL